MQVFSGSRVKAARSAIFHKFLFVFGWFHVVLFDHSCEAFTHLFGGNISIHLLYVKRNSSDDLLKTRPETSFLGITQVFGRSLFSFTV